MRCRGQVVGLRRILLAVSFALGAAAALAHLPLVAQTPPTDAKAANSALDASASEETSKILSNIVLSSPRSLESARTMLSKARYIKPEDSQALLALVKKVQAILYEPVAPVGSLTLDSALLVSEQVRLLYGIVDEAVAGRFSTQYIESSHSALGYLLGAMAWFYVSDESGFRQAQAYLDYFEGFGVESVGGLIIKAMEENRRGNNEAALGLFKKAKTMAPEAWPAIAGEAASLLGLDRVSEALLLAKPLAKAYPTSFIANKTCALALFRDGRTAESGTFTMAALAVVPSDYDLLTCRIYSLLDAGDATGAFNLAMLLGKIISPARRQCIAIAQASQATNRYDTAFEWARRGLALWPTDLELQVIMVECQSKKGQKSEDEAYALAEKTYLALDVPGTALSIAPDFTQGARSAVVAQARGKLAMVLASKAGVEGDWAKAQSYISDLRAVPEGMPLVCTILRMTKNPSALAISKEWLKKEPNRPEAIEAYYRSVGAFESPKKAATILDDALTHAKSAHLRSIILYLRGQIEPALSEARKFYMQALVEEADNVDALIALADLHFDIKDYQRSSFYLRQARLLAPNDAELSGKQERLNKALAN